MELNAFTKSRKIATVSLFWIKLDETVSTSYNTASVADLFLKSELLFIYSFMLISEINHPGQKKALKDFFAQIGVTEICR